jgi:excisionase family DNA binding protein
MDEKMLTVRDIMARLRVSRPKVFELKRERGLPFIKMGARTLRFPERAVNQWLKERKQSA